MEEAVGSVVVTGGTSGIGLAVATTFARAGRRVFVVSREPRESLAVLSAARPSPDAPEPTFVAADVRDADSLRAAVDRVHAATDDVRTVVSAAGVNVRKLALEVADEDLRRMLDTNVFGAFKTFQLFAPPMLSRPGSRFIGIGSVAGRHGMQLRSMYCATKGAMSALVQSLAVEWSPHGATVNCVAPGIVDTPLTRGYLDRFPELEPRVVENTPVGRLGAPQDVAGAVAFLASAQADFITGQTLAVDGGFSGGNTWW